MDTKLKFYLSDLVKNDRGISEVSVKELQSFLDFELLDDYITLMKEFNGGEGRRTGSSSSKSNNRSYEKYGIASHGTSKEWWTI